MRKAIIVYLLYMGIGQYERGNIIAAITLCGIGLFIFVELLKRYYKWIIYSRS